MFFLRRILNFIRKVLGVVNLHNQLSSMEENQKSLEENQLYIIDALKKYDELEALNQLELEKLQEIYKTHHLDIQKILDRLEILDRLDRLSELDALGKLENQLSNAEKHLANSIASSSSNATTNKMLLERYYRDVMLELDKLTNFIPQPVFEIKTDYPIAIDSVDHLYPLGTAIDNTRSQRFVRACEKIISKRPLKFLDLGCAGGGLVLDFILRDHLAVGLEGSDYSLLEQRAEWRVLPNNLFTCDITKPFKVKYIGQPRKRVLFDIITAWDVMEHIPKDNLPTLLKNIRTHLSDEGFFVASIALIKSIQGDPGIDYHVTLEPKEWWEMIFKENGLIMLNEHPFTLKDFCRGSGNWPENPKISYESWPERGFHVVAKKI